LNVGIVWIQLHPFAVPYEGAQWTASAGLSASTVQMVSIANKIATGQGQQTMKELVGAISNKVLFGLFRNRCRTEMKWLDSR
jgi:hypothetical protein